MHPSDLLQEHMLRIHSIATASHEAPARPPISQKESQEALHGNKNKRETQDGHVKAACLQTSDGAN